jgi:cation transport regulator ChaC
MSSVGTEENLHPLVPLWCEERQIYIGGIVPEYAQVASFLEQNGGYLRLFGYGSLCWNPGEGAALSKPGVKSTLGRAKGYRRCWAQRSTDHRGTPRFPGIVCTILRDEEVLAVRRLHNNGEGEFNGSPKALTLTEGVLYTVPPELAQECLAELDFREKGVSWCAMFMTMLHGIN